MPPVRLKTRKGLLFDDESETPAAQMAEKRHSKKFRILAFLREHGPMSRIEIARGLGFNHRSVSLLLDDLLKTKLVTEEEVRTTHTGRPPTPVALNPVAASVLGIDITRSTTKVALMDLQGNVLHRDQRPTITTNVETEQAAWLESIVMEFLGAAGRGAPPLAGAGFSPVGILHRQLPSRRHQASAQPLRLHLQKLLRVPVIEKVDSYYMALSEQWFGAARGVENVLVFNLSDGLGLSCIIDGRILSGYESWAGQVGHIAIGEPGIKCYCGAHSCLENTASGSGMLRIAEQWGVKLGRSRNVEKLASLAEQGSPEALQVFRRFADGLAAGIAITIGLLAPTVIILGGPVSRFSHLFITDVQDIVKKSVPTIRPEVEIRISSMSEDAILLGTCAAMLNQIYESPGDH